MQEAAWAHQPLIDFLEDEAERRHLTLGELAETMHMNPSQLYNLRNGKQPGLKVCLTIARHTKTRIDYILFLAGQIDQTELNGREGLTVREERIFRLVESLRDTPYYEMVLRLMEQALDMALFGMDAPE